MLEAHQLGEWALALSLLLCLNLELCGQREQQASAFALSCVCRHQADCVARSFVRAPVSSGCNHNCHFARVVVCTDGWKVVVGSWTRNGWSLQQVVKHGDVVVRGRCGGREHDVSSAKEMAFRWGYEAALFDGQLLRCFGVRGPFTVQELGDDWLLPSRALRALSGELKRWDEVEGRVGQRVSAVKLEPRRAAALASLNIAGGDTIKDHRIRLPERGVRDRLVYSMPLREGELSAAVRSRYGLKCAVLAAIWFGLGVIAGLLQCRPQSV